MREAGGTACSGGRLACRKPGILPGGTSPRIPKASGYLSMAEQPGVLSVREIRTGVCTCRFAAADAALNGSQDDCRYAKHLRRHGVRANDRRNRREDGAARTYRATRKNWRPRVRSTMNEKRLLTVVKLVVSKDHALRSEEVSR